MQSDQCKDMTMMPVLISALDKGPWPDTSKTLLRICLKASTAFAGVNDILKLQNYEMGNSGMVDTILERVSLKLYVESKSGSLNRI